MFKAALISLSLAILLGACQQIDELRARVSPSPQSALENPWLTHTPDEPDADLSAWESEPPQEAQLLQATLSLRELGLREGLELRGLSARQEIFLPINQGAVPEAFELELTTSPAMPQGYLRFESGERILGQIPLPTEETSLSIPLQGAEVQQGALELSVSMALEGDDVCQAEALYSATLAPESRLRLGGVRRAPQEIGGFFPAHLNRVRMYLPNPPGEDAAQAALWLASYLARRYPGRVPRLSLTATPNTLTLIPDPDPFERIIVWQPGAGARLAGLPGANRGEVLLLGSAREAAQLFHLPEGDQLAVTSALRNRELELTHPEELRPQVSLADLGFEARTLMGIGTLTSSYTFSLADFGYRREPLGFRLRADHSPVLATERAYLQVSLNNRTLRSIPLRQQLIDEWISIPSRHLLRDNTLELRFQYSSPGGECRRGSLPLSVTVDPGSAFNFHESRSLPPGFDHFPPAYTTRFGVLLEPIDLFKLTQASKLISAMQNTTRRRLEPVIVSQASEGTPMLAVGNASMAESLGAPVHAPGFQIRDAQERWQLSFEPQDPYAVLQGFRLAGADTLVLSHAQGDGSLMNPLLDELLGQDGWFAVSGDLAVRGPTGPAVSMRVIDTELRVTALPEPPTAWLVRYRLWIYLGVTLLLLIVLALLYPNVVRRGKR